MNSRDMETFSQNLQDFAPEVCPEGISKSPPGAKAIEDLGSPGRTRTSDPAVNSGSVAAKFLRVSGGDAEESSDWATRGLRGEGRGPPLGRQRAREGLRAEEEGAGATSRSAPT
jgi:hypothetical protein